jgi:hypothetical protein
MRAPVHYSVPSSIFLWMLAPAWHMWIWTRKTHVEVHRNAQTALGLDTSIFSNMEINAGLGYVSMWYTISLASMRP